MKQKYQKFLKFVNELYDIQYAQELLGWDQETYMPHKGLTMRAKCQGTLAGLHHEKFTCDEFVALVKDLRQENLKDDQAVNLREIERKQQRALKLPRDLVIELTDAESHSYKAWVEARAKGDFAIFTPWLNKVLSLQRKAAQLVGFEGSIYNAFLNIYDPDAKAEEVAPLFVTLRKNLVNLLEKIVATGKLPSDEMFNQSYSTKRQEALNQRILRDMGFDTDAGRLDVTVHPFCCGLSRDDVRLTTRYTSRWPESWLSTLHEGGHGLYEQGLPHDAVGSPVGQSLSPSVHESQSRMWENIVGRSYGFLRYYLPVMKEVFPEQLHNVQLDEFYASLNRVEPSLIRTDADEVTYNLHIILRFELEKDLVEGRVKVEDLPTEWNERVHSYLGIRPSNDVNGVLQDVHWSLGYIGYFPTYALGNLYSAQFFNQAKKDIPGLMEKIADGRLSLLTDWLKQKIHSRGSRVTADELSIEVTGESLNADYFSDYLNKKYQGLYLAI